MSDAGSSGTDARQDVEHRPQRQIDAEEARALSDATVVAAGDDGVPLGDGDASTPLVAFSAFKRSQSFHLCRPEEDCAGSVELHADGTLRVDRAGVPDYVWEKQLSDADLARALEVLLDPALVALFDEGGAVCRVPMDASDYLTLTRGDQEQLINILGCDEGEVDVIDAARRLLDSLADRYTRGPPCDCTNTGCPAGWRCLQSQPASFEADGLTCGRPTGLAECRPLCNAAEPCPTDRPHCIEVSLSLGCCSEVSAATSVCCANADATGASDCW